MQSVSIGMGVFMENIRTKEFEFLSSNKYVDIHGKMWIPDTEIRAVVQISHGMAEHIERYGDFAGFLAKNGILVVGNDHMGHGKSINTEDDLGYFAIPVKGIHGRKKEKYSSSSLTVKDLHHITKTVKKHYPGIPYILLGHSMGSFLARRYLMQYGEELDGIIIMGTGNQSALKVYTAKVISKIISAVKGERYRSKTLNKIMFGAYNRRIKKHKGINDWVTSDAGKLAEYDSDDRCGFIFTMNGIDALLSTIQYIIKPEHIEKIPTDVNMLILSGTDDPVGDYGTSVKKVYEEYSKHGVKDITVKLYDGCRHELINEKARDIVYADILDWIETHVIY